MPAHKRTSLSLFPRRHASGRYVVRAAALDTQAKPPLPRPSPFSASCFFVPRASMQQQQPTAFGQSGITPNRCFTLLFFLRPTFPPRLQQRDVTPSITYPPSIIGLHRNPTRSVPECSATRAALPISLSHLLFLMHCPDQISLSPFFFRPMLNRQARAPARAAPPTPVFCRCTRLCSFPVFLI
jgi:hypothetical protein